MKLEVDLSLKAAADRLSDLKFKYREVLDVIVPFALIYLLVGAVGGFGSSLMSKEEKCLYSNNFVRLNPGYHISCFMFQPIKDKNESYR